MGGVEPVRWVGWSLWGVGFTIVSEICKGLRVFL